jgi:hypothetical protein
MSQDVIDGTQTSHAAILIAPCPTFVFVFSSVVTNSTNEGWLVPRSPPEANAKDRTTYPRTSSHMLNVHLHFWSPLGRFGRFGRFGSVNAAKRASALYRSTIARGPERPWFDS